MFKKSEYFEVTDSDLERLIFKTYGIRYEIADREEWDEGRNHISADADPVDADISDFLAGKNPSYALRAILCALCVRGIIEPGDYLVEVMG